MEREQIEYIWSGKLSFGVSPSRVPTFNFRDEDANGSSVLVLFVLARSPLFLEGTSGTTGDKEQVLATMVSTVAIRRCVSISAGPLFSTTPSEPPNSIFFSCVREACA